MPPPPAKPPPPTRPPAPATPPPPPRLARPRAASRLAARPDCKLPKALSRSDRFAPPPTLGRSAAPPAILGRLPAPPPISGRFPVAAPPPILGRFPAVLPPTLGRLAMFAPPPGRSTCSPPRPRKSIRA